MEISERGNNIFHQHAQVGASLYPCACKVALTPSSSRAVALQNFDWESLFINQEKREELVQDKTSEVNTTEFSGIELVLGMENGMSKDVLEQCDHHIYIPQYGSVGSLSMLSALAIATHHATCALHNCQHERLADDHEKLCSEQKHEHRHETEGIHKKRKTCSSYSNCNEKHIRVKNAVLRGHMPKSSAPHITSKSTTSIEDSSVLSETLNMSKRLLPHEASLLNYTNDEIIDLLASRRRTYPLQLSIVMYNELGDRNIGAVMRNANVYNCEWMLVLGRRRFNRRGALGTHHLLDLHLLADNEENRMFVKNVLSRDYVIWLVYQYYPYLQITNSENIESSKNRSSESSKEYTGDDTNYKACKATNLETFIACDDARLIEWTSSIHELTQEHPLTREFPHLNAASALYLNDTASVFDAVHEVHRSRKKGIALVFAEEGCTFNPFLAQLASRVVFLLHPSLMVAHVQRGLNAALASSIVLERLRTTIDCLDNCEY